MMGVVTTLQDIRNDIETLAPADVLKELDWCIDRLCEWERDDRDALNYRQPPGRDCWTCRSRKQDEIGATSVFVGIRVQTCRKFYRGDGRRGTPLPCGYAYDVFCGGGDYEPDFWTRLVNMVRR